MLYLLFSALNRLKAIPGSGPENRKSNRLFHVSKICQKFYENWSITSKVILLTDKSSHQTKLRRKRNLVGKGNRNLLRRCYDRVSNYTSTATGENVKCKT